LTNFTGADAVVTVTGGSNIAIMQVTSGHSSNKVITVTGAVSKYTEVTIRITWNSTNSGGVIAGDWSVSTGASNGPLPIPGLTCN
jgi:hypothetical protein